MVGGGEFVNKSFKNHCAELGINHIISPPYTPQHNPFAERGNQSILEKARFILLKSQLTIKFWAEAVSTATFLCSLIPKYENQKNHMKYGIIQNYHYLASKAWEEIFLKYENESSSYCILRISDQKIIISRHVFFDKETFPPLPSQKQFTEDIVRIFPNPIQTTKEFPTDSNTEEDSSSSELNSVDNEEEDTYVDALEHKPKRIRVIGPRHPTLILSKIDSNNILPFPRRQARENLTSLNPNPKTFSEAMISPNREDWDLAIKRELQNMKKLDVWTLRNKKDYDHPITSTWVFKRKIDNTGKTIEYKACLCAHGFHQIAGLDFRSTFAPTGRLSSLHALISFATIHRYDFHQMDIQSAFLYAPLQDKICLEIPHGVLEKKEKQVLQLNKALYGLKQASLAWYKHLSNWLISSSFQGSLTDPCVFWIKDKNPIWIYVHVDDLAIFGIKINHLKDGFSLDQEHYINELDNKYEIEKLTPSNTPLKPHLQPSNSSNEEHEDFNNLNINYQSAIGSLNYISSNTRPDITFATYADADWGNSPINRRSISGFTISINSHLISWCSKKQQTVSHLTTEARYQSLIDAAKETTWLINLINEIQLATSPLNPLLLNDNKGAVDLVLNHANHSGFKAKHMDIKFHFIRELLKKVLCC
ncbi:hypothetical protein O181_023684 [Austropuccinia psidii MF-1]|uniref:Integrase catalytic domain-containing protein n=1 Tax=Austropuccinia psidii MF-1 TaxID=1389203 RepID=A0A9Q3GYX0_9BASI|nr:hypothetical protein [Austropuccinia psidii MF-1]